MSKRPSKKLPAIKEGDRVLLGGTRASYPGEWYMGSVLWTGTDGDILVNRSTVNGGTWRQLEHATSVRAVGTIDELIGIKETARKAVKVFSDAVRERETELGRARDALFAELDRLAEGGLKIIPPNFEAIERAGQTIRATVEQSDIEREAERTA